MPTKRCQSCLRFGRRKLLDPAPPRLVNTASIERPVFIEINPTEFCGQQLRSYMRGLRAPHLVGVRPVTTQPRTDSTDVTVCSPGVSLLHDVNQTAGFWSGGTHVSSRFGLIGLLRARAFAVWWSQTGSNRRPPACKAGALPTELWPRLEPAIRRIATFQALIFKEIQPPREWWAWKDLNFRPHAYQARALTN